MNPLFETGHALIIGVGNDLPKTVGDAEALGKVLIDSERAAYDPSNVNVCTNQKASRNGILAALDELSQNVSANDSVIMYYSGHGGVLSDSDEFFLVPNDYDPSNPKENWVSAKELQEKVKKVNSKKFVMLLDCCHAAAAMTQKSIDQLDGFSKGAKLAERLDDGSGSVIFSSCRDDEYSYILNEDDHSLFTQCLMEALEGRHLAVKEGEYVKILDVMSYIFEEVPKRSKDKQHPYLNNISDLSSNFAISYLPASIRKSIGTVVAGKKDNLGLQLEMDGITSNLELLTEQMSFFNQQKILAIDPAMKFALDKQLLEKTQLQANFRQRIEDIMKLLGN